MLHERTIEPAPVMVSVAHRALVIPDDARVRAVFPNARLLPDGSRLAVRHGCDEVRVLRNLGYSAPSPIHHHYDWPGEPPFAAQRVTASLLTTEPRAFVLNGLGTGKTRSVLYAFDFLRQEGLARRMLVAAPLSTLNFAWAREIQMIFPHLRAQVIYGTAAKRRKILAEKADVFIINHDGLRVVSKELEARGIDTWVFDEVSAFRNARAQRSRLAQRLTAKARRVWGLTGTPTPREPTDAFGIAKLIAPHRAPRNFTHFRSDVMLQVSQFRWVPRADAPGIVHDLLQPAVRFRLEDCMDMPPGIEIDREVAMSAQATKVYEVIRKHARALHERHEITAANEGVVRSKLLQVCAGSVYDTKKEVAHLDIADRLACLRELVEESDRKVLVFCNWKSTVRRVHGELTAMGFEFDEITGDTPVDARTETFSRLQNDRSPMKGIVAHPRTMSHGLTLTGADTIVWFSLPDDLEIYEQANGRIIRPGQDSHRTVIAHLIASPLEKAVRRRLQAKQSLQGALLELFQS